MVLYNSAMNKKELSECRLRLEKYLQDILELLGRRERRHWGNVYVRGLILDGERKSIEPMARRMLEGNIQAMQQFIGQSPWEYRPVRKRLAEKMSKELVPVCAWIVDDTGFTKKGSNSVGVANQYSGTLGKVGNCQVAVSLNLAIGEACIPLNFALYLPESWTKDPDRLKKAGVPADVSFKSKIELAFDLIDEALSWDVPLGVMVSDSFYGKAQEFRQGLIDRKMSYVVEVSSKNAVYEEALGAGRKRQPREKERKTILVQGLAKALPAWKWKTIRWREGTKGRLVSRFAAIRVEPYKGKKKNAKSQPRQWLLMEWPLNKKEPCKFWFSNLPPQAGLRRLVNLAKRRWMVEQNYQQQKEELGLDHYEGRGWLGWHHHVTMNMIAYGFLILEKLRYKKNYWVDPAEDTPDDPRTISDLDRNLSHLRKEGLI